MSSNSHDDLGACLAHPAVKLKRLCSAPVNGVHGVVEREEENSDALKRSAWLTT